MIGLDRLRENIWVKTLFFILAVLAFLLLNAAFSQPAGATVTGPDEAVSDTPDQVIADATSDVVTDVPDEVVNDSSDQVIADATSDVVTDVPDEVVNDSSDDSVIEALDEVVSDTPDDVVAEVVDEIVETADPNADEAQESVVFGEEGVEVDIPVLGDEPVADLTEEIPVAVEDLSSVLNEVLTSLPPVDMFGVLPVLTPETPILTPEMNVAAATITFSPVGVGGSGLDVRQASTAIETSQPRSLAETLHGEQLGTELALFRLSNVTSHAATGPGFSSSPGEGTVPGLAPYTPLPRTVPVERGPAGPAQGSSTHAGGGHFGAIDPYGFFAAMAALLALCLVGWIRDRSRSGRSIFPSHGGRPG